MNKLDKAKKILNKFTKITSNRMFLVFFLIIGLILSFYFYNQRYTFYKKTGDFMFGTKVLGYTFYNLNIAEYFLTKASNRTNNSISSPEMWTNYQLSRINFIRGNFPGAISFADKELESYPNNCRTHYIRGLAYGYLDDLDNAIEDFEQFNNCFPGTWAGHNDLAWFWFRKGNMNKVIEVIEPTARIYITNAWVQNTYGTALMNVGRYEEAKKALLIAQNKAGMMTEENWGASYPGNNPIVYSQGLGAMRKSINTNLNLLERLKKENLDRTTQIIPK